MSDMDQAAYKLSGSLERLMESAAALGRSALESSRESLEAEQRRCMAVAFLASGVFLMLGLAGLFAGVAVIFVFQTEHSAWAAAAVAGVYWSMAVAAALYMRRFVRQRHSHYVLIAALAGVVAEILRTRRC